MMLSRSNLHGLIAVDCDLLILHLDLQIRVQHFKANQTMVGLQEENDPKQSRSEQTTRANQQFSNGTKAAPTVTRRRNRLRDCVHACIMLLDMRTTA